MRGTGPTPFPSHARPAARRRRGGAGSLERGSTRVGGHATGRASLSHGAAPGLAQRLAGAAGRPTLARLTVRWVLGGKVEWFLLGCRGR